MPRPHQQTQTLIDRLLVGKIGPHILAADQEDDEEQKGQDKMKAWDRRLTYTFLRIPVTVQFSKHEDLPGVVCIVSIY